MKKSTRAQVYRMRRILDMIRRGMALGRLASAGMMARELEVSWHTVIRDLDRLRDDEGAPIAYDASRKGYVLADGDWQLAPVTLNQGEVFAFSLAPRMLQPFQGTPLEMDMRSLFAKIARSLSGTVTMSPDALTEHVTMLGEDYVPVDRDRWVEMAGHVERREPLRIRYRTFAGKEKAYHIRPVHLLAYHGNWYVVAFRSDKPDAATFALSRILRVESSAQAVAVPADFSLDGLLSRFFGVTGGDRERAIHVRFSPAVATYIGERVWHRGQTMHWRRDGRLDVCFRTRGWKELVRWVLSWQPDVEVIKPVELRDRVHEKMSLALGHRLKASQKNPKKA